MLSRHLYEIDEVVAALMWSCKQRRLVEVAFWLQELVESEVLDEIYRALYTFWIWQIGIARLDLFKELYNLFHKEEEIQCADLHMITQKMANTKPTERDSSIFVLLVLGSQDKIPPDRTTLVGALNTFFEDMQLSYYEKAFLRACYQGKACLAWFLSGPLWKEDAGKVWHLLKALIGEKHPALLQQLDYLQQNECGLSWEVKAAAICIACLPINYTYKEYTSPPISQEISEALKSWSLIDGRRKRRVYAIPHDCLYYITSRGCLSNKEINLRKVYCSSYEDLRGCPFWNTVLDQNQPWLSDEQLELFWDTLFPDDIPDEWSLEDQMKSHGYGVLINQEKPRYSKFADKWFRSTPSRLIWLGSLYASKALLQEQIPYGSWEEVYGRKEYEPSTWSISPVVKQLEEATSS